jgi:hypothetical protein
MPKIIPENRASAFVYFEGMLYFEVGRTIW